MERHGNRYSMFGDGPVMGRLTREQVRQYHDQGYIAPFPGIEPDEARAMCADLERFSEQTGMSAGNINLKGHLCFRRSYEFCFRAEILDVVEDLIGPNILAFASRFWIKPGMDGSFVSWHQDSAYFGLEPHELVTVWLALTPSHTGNGCVRVLPGSHRGAAHAHVETFDNRNLLARGQSIADIDSSQAVDLVLRTGEFSCHHERIVHGSEPNRTSAPRIGMAVFYIPAHIRSTIGRRTALLVRGVDDHGHWDADPVPRENPDLQIFDHVLSASSRYSDPKYRQETEL